MHAFIILNFLDKINAFNHEKVLYQMSKCTFTFPMQCLFGRQKAKGGPKSQITFLKNSYILRRPQNFAKHPPIICPMYCQSNNWWRFRKIVWPSQNI